ncbi:MAG: hypothetical protein LN588_01735 [Rickettsia endosymbiont of Bryobia graminum]|nr:hypothetical protein [Rickettsia endosymbiont of Bryobia graminum]
MSKVSAKSSETILALSKKSSEHKEALIEIAEEIKKGTGYKRIEQLVNAIISGNTHTGEEEIITSKSRQAIGKWKDGKLLFNKDLAVNRKKLNKMLIEFFNKDIY